jgi:hypothetical protein
MAALLACNECYSDYLQSTMDQGEMNAAQIKPGKLLFPVNPIAELTVLSCGRNGLLLALPGEQCACPVVPTNSPGWSNE